MRRTNRITALVMLAALVAVAVGVAVWPTPEEAKAQDETFQVRLEENLIGVDNVWLEIIILDVNGNFVFAGGPMNNLGNGNYQIVIDVPSNGYRWQIFIDEPNVEPDDPAINPHTVGIINWQGQNQFTWQVIDNR